MPSVAVLMIVLVVNAAVIPMDCVQVQSLVAQYGKARALAWAVEQIALGTYSWKELRAAKRCLDQPKGKS